MRALAILPTFVLAACTGGPSLLEDGGVESTGPSGDPHATLLATIDGAAACELTGVVEVVLRATIVGCDPPPPAPCTLPVDPIPIEGDRMTCPSSETQVLLGVEVPRTGEWRVEAAYRYVTEPDSFVCYAPPGATEPVAVVTMADLDAFAEIEVVSQGGPCPGG
jgi:hypothetical protein